MSDVDHDRRAALARTCFRWVTAATALAAWTIIAIDALGPAAADRLIAPWPLIAVAIFLTLLALYAIRLRRRALRPIAHDAIPSAPHPKTNP